MKPYGILKVPALADPAVGFCKRPSRINGVLIEESESKDACNRRVEELAAGTPRFHFYPVHLYADTREAKRKIRVVEERHAQPLKPAKAGVAPAPRLIATRDVC